MARAEATEPGPTARELERAGTPGVAGEPVGEGEGHRVGRTGARDPDAGDGTPAAVLDDRPQPRGHDLEDRARPERRGPGWRHHRRRLDPLARAGHGEADPISRGEHGEGPTFRGEEGDAGPTHQVPSARRRGRVHRSVAVGDRHRPGGHDRARAGAARRPLQPAGQSSEVGEPRGEPDHLHAEGPCGQECHHVVGRAPGERSHLVEVRAVEPAGNGERAAPARRRSPTRRPRARARAPSPQRPGPSGAPRRGRSRGPRRWRNRTPPRPLRPTPCPVPAPAPAPRWRRRTRSEGRGHRGAVPPRRGRTGSCTCRRDHIDLRVRQGPAHGRRDGDGPW